MAILQGCEDPYRCRIIIQKPNWLLTSGLRDVDRTRFRKYVGVDTMTYFKVHNDLVVTMQAAVMKFSLEIGGKEMESVQAKYGWEKKVT